MGSQDGFSQLINLYISYFNIINFDATCIIKVVNDIFIERVRLCNSLEENTKLEKGKDNYKDLNGLVVFPDEIDKNFYILIKHARVNENLDFAKTLCHEFTHVIDFADYMKHYSLTTLRMEPNIEDYNSYEILSEFKARYRSFVIYFHLVDFPHVLESYDILCDDYFKLIKDRINKKDYGRCLYFLSQFLGQYEAINMYFKLQLPLPKFIYNLNLESLCKKIMEVTDEESLFNKTIEVINEVEKRFKSEYL